MVIEIGLESTESLMLKKTILVTVKMDMKFFIFFIGLLSFANAFWKLDLKKAEETLKEIEKEEQIFLEQKAKEARKLDEERELIEKPGGENEIKYKEKKNLDFNQQRCVCDCKNKNDLGFQFEFDNSEINFENLTMLTRDFGKFLDPKN
jgi:hypothetical protein